MSQTDSLVNCSAYKKGIKTRDFPIGDISDIIREEDTFVWVGLREPDQGLLKVMEEEFGLHELAIEDANHAHQRPKLEEYGETLFVVLYSACVIDGRIHYGETHIFVGLHFVVTVRHGDSLGYQQVRQRCESMPDRMAKGPGYVLYAIIDFIVDQYQPCMDLLQEQFRSFESELFDVASQEDNLEDFYKLKNDVLLLEAAAVPLIDICTRLLRFHTDLIPKENRVYYRDILDHVSRITQECERMREMINAAMQVALARVTIRQNEVVKKLAGWGAILAIPTMVFSLYGMNFDVMPELRWRWGYPLTLAGILIGCTVLYRRLKRVGWI